MDPTVIHAISQAASTGSSGTLDFLSSISTLAPLLQGGLLGLFAFLLVKRIWIMPVGEFNDYKASTERAIAATKEASDARIAKLEADLDAQRATNADLTDTIIKQVVPAVTRVAGPLSELVELKRAQPRRRGRDDD